MRVDQRVRSDYAEVNTFALRMRPGSEGHMPGMAAAWPAGTEGRASEPQTRTGTEGLT